MAKKLSSAQPTRELTGKIDPRIDRIIQEAPAFAQPILRHLRGIVHAGCPGVEESVKWGRPTFSHGGRLLCGMAAFTAHCGFGFWHPEMAKQVGSEQGTKDKQSSGQFGRLTSLADLPDDATLLRYVTRAAELNEANQPARRPTAERKPRADLPTPPEFDALLKENPAAARFFAASSRSCRREYLEWIMDAKREETRAKRMATAIEWLAEGKNRNWRYEAG